MFWGKGGAKRKDEEYMLHKRGICVKHVRVSKDIYSAYTKLPLEKLAKKENNPLSICRPPTDSRAWVGE
jgi:hypothetical protein